MEQINIGPMRVNLPDEHREGVFTSGFTARIEGDAVSLLFFRECGWQDDPADDAVAEVVAHVVIDKARWNNLPDVLAAMRDGLAGEPDESPENPAS